MTKNCKPLHEREDLGEALKARVVELSRFYYRERERRCRIPFLKNYALHSGKIFMQFARAISIILHHDASYEDYLDAQIERLKFTNKGEGCFPSPHHLGTYSAEDAYLQFMHKNYEDYGAPVECQVAELMLTESERHRSISDHASVHR